jgi:hypothetical protein
MSAHFWDRSLTVVNILSGAFILVVLVLVLMPALDRRPYAQRVFDGVSYDRVIASKETFTSADDAGWGCTFAIVELSADADVAPVNEDGLRHWHDSWGEAWLETPVAHPGPQQRDALADCSDEWPPGTYESLRSAILAPGSYYLRDSVGETVMVYSKPHRIAARVRFGD